MPGSDELYPPAQYGWGWMLLAIGILALLVLGAWLLIVLTRPRRTLAIADANAGQAPLIIDVLSQLRTRIPGRASSRSRPSTSNAASPPDRRTSS